jgi:hypothetical protein
MWVIYVPRDDETLKKVAEAWIPIRATKGGEKKLVSDVNTHAATDRKHRVVVVKYPAVIPDASTLTNLDVVYVMGGHCTGGSENVTWPDNHKNPIKYDEVANRLVTAGLQDDFAGKIKVYSCQSGVGGDDAFGKRFANYMRGDKHFTCEVWAYTGNIGTEYINAKPGEGASGKEKIKAMQLMEELREAGGIHKFMQPMVAKPYIARAKDSKHLV